MVTSGWLIHLCCVNKKFNNLASVLQVIAAKNPLLYPIDDFIIRFISSFNTALPCLSLEMGYTVARENACKFVSFQSRESNSEISWISGLNDCW